jgi:threonine dehydrogenase-like Zn-dependent dehydrogenase
MGLTAFDTVLITGAGPVGLGAVVNACFRGSQVIVAETVPYRMERARELGAAHVIDPKAPDGLAQIKELTGGCGADCALDCAGNVAAQRFCMDGVRRKGKVAFVGECREDLPVRVSPDLLRRGITVVGVWHYNLNDFPKIMKVIQGSPVIDRLISHVLPMSRIQDALELSATHQTAKIILHPWE